jgi:CPA1 family monovalent cation:H+ antiporter
LLTILEGESLLNDASALLIFRLAVGAVATNSFSISAVAPTFLFVVAGSVVAGPALGWLILRMTERIRHIPTTIILQFIGTFGVWMLAERVGLSGVLTTVCCAMAIARTAPERVSARTRIPTNAVWQTVIFALNILAFIFIGLQIRPILESLDAADRGPYFAVAGAVLLTVIVVRFAWHIRLMRSLDGGTVGVASIHRDRCCGQPWAAAIISGQACAASSRLWRPWPPTRVSLSGRSC